MKNKEYHVANFATIVSKTLIFFLPKKWMNSTSNQLSTAIIKYLNWPRPVFGQFNNGDNKVVIEPRVVRFWSEIILVISNRNHAYDFSSNCTPLNSITIINTLSSIANQTASLPLAMRFYVKPSNKVYEFFRDVTRTYLKRILKWSEKLIFSLVGIKMKQW